MKDTHTIRDLINLVESVGLANRRTGETFANPAGDEWTFQSLDFYPQSGRVAKDQLDRLVASLSRKGINPQKILWVNRATSATGGFGIAAFDTDSGPVYVGRWFGNINPNRTQNFWPNDALPGNFRLHTKAAKKETSDLKPSAILTQFQNNTPDTIVGQVDGKFGAKSDQSRAIRAFMSQDFDGGRIIVPAGNMDKTAFQDYFCELLGPIALVQGKAVAGNALEAADIFFGPNSGYQDCTISFNHNSVGGLYDSLLVNSEGRQIKLSSKGKEGATASVTNLTRSLNELSGTPNGAKLIKKYKKAVEIIKTIQKEGQYRAPLVLAQELGIIDADEVQQVLDLRSVPAGRSVIGKGMLSANLEDLYNRRGTRSQKRAVPFFHLLASVAFTVADRVNKSSDFSEAASAILNNAALVQLYTTVTQQGSNFAISMRAQYPSEAVTGVLLDPEKVYYSTGNKGNFTFKILKNNASPQDVNPADPVDSESLPVDLDAVTTRPRLTGPGARAARTRSAPKTTADVLGREKRRR